MPRTIDELYFGSEGGPPMPAEVRAALRGLGELLVTLAVGPYPSAELVAHMEWAAGKVAEVLDLARLVLGAPSLGPPEKESGPPEK